MVPMIQCSAHKDTTSSHCLPSISNVLFVKKCFDFALTGSGGDTLLDENSVCFDKKCTIIFAFSF